MKNVKPIILIVEDEAFLLRALKHRLQRNGFEILEARDGVEVMKIMKAKKPDLVLLDLIMPKKNGFDTLREIKKSKKFNQIPIIILSNLGQEDDIQKCLEMGAVDYLIKSDFSLTDILAKIKLHLNKN